MCPITSPDRRNHPYSMAVPSSDAKVPRGLALLGSRPLRSVRVAPVTLVLEAAEAAIEVVAHALEACVSDVSNVVPKYKGAFLYSE